MQLSSLLGLRVLDAGHHRVGTVIDVRLRLTGDSSDHPRSPELTGLVISPRTGSSYLGYERTDLDAPWLIATIAAWRHRGTFLASGTMWAESGLATSRCVLAIAETHRLCGVSDLISMAVPQQFGEGVLREGLPVLALDDVGDPLEKES
ncbi:hypothetical protein [Mycobacterium sp. DL440]|uniref:hypothetical protein n=1 Tax=Mycobacterium sp. DL440 TaxID=2675523 RepID=UPI001FB8F18A|nr:hypothetical protein [Mycobacterium sp. DL440]